jgi:putative ATP-binding cassette transporter
MELFRLFRDEADGDGAKLVTATIFSGIVNALLVAVVIMAASHTSVPSEDSEPASAYVYSAVANSTWSYLALFVLCLLAYTLSRRYVLTQSANLAERIVTKIRIRIVDKIRRSNLLLYERVGRSHIYSALNESTFTISSSASSIVSGLSAIFMLGFATLYVAYLSLPAFWLTLACIVAGVLAFGSIRESLNQEMKRSVEQEKKFFDVLAELLDGFKEVKLHQRRNDDLYDNFLVQTARETEDFKKRTAQRLAGVAIFGQTFLYTLIGVIVFILPLYSAEDAAKIVPIATVTLFIMGPLGEVVGALPYVARSNAAISHIADLEKALDAAAGRVAHLRQASSAEKHTFRQLTLQDITFAYDIPPRSDSFQLGPLNFKCGRREIIFLIGGNGSGKSTLLKVLTGLYPPTEGKMMIDDEPVTASRLGEYRSLFSTVFADAYLFGRLYGLRDQDAATVEALFERLEISKVVSLEEGGRFSTTSLSTGQRKRLALAVAILERRPILVLDEFAADQDPSFRKYFYEELLHEFRRDGQTIIAATHDDHYFQHADRILKMEFGQFEDATASYA